MLPEFIFGLIKSFIALFIIIDPFLGMVVFISLTKKESQREKAKAALVAVLVAAGLLGIFLFFGLSLLGLVGISLPSFIVAGGIILLILGIQAVLGIEFSQKEKKRGKAAAVVIGTPLLCGPGAITTIIILAQQYGLWPPLIALVLSLAITWLMLFYSKKIFRFLGERLIEVLSRVMGLLLVALAAEFIKEGVLEIIKRF